MPHARSNHSVGRLLGTTAVIVLGVFLTGSYCQTCLSSRQLSSNFVSSLTWHSLTKSFQGASHVVSNPDVVDVPFWIVIATSAVIAMVTWFAGAIWIAWRRRIDWLDALVRWGWYGGIWWCLVDVWEWLWIAAGAIGLTGISELLSVTPQFWLAGCLAGCLTTWIVLNARDDSKVVNDTKSIRIRWLWFACGIYFVVFTAMNWRLYFNLLVPHGDSGMYEEHLWNVLHGKGFRSYLDQGLFWGEHIQFVHLFLLPLYAIWPSHLLLEACSSAALACGAWPVFWMVRRHTGSDRTALAIAVAYLLYFPMQFVDIEIDLKTFRPESFGIPLLLLTLDQLDRRNLVGTLAGIGMCLTVKEDYAIVFGPLGLWIAMARTHSLASGGPQSDQRGQEHIRHGFFREDFSEVFSNFKTRVLLGLSVSVFSVVYLWLATRVVMPWFRSGVEVHYASYFARFGKSPEEIVGTMFGNPGLVFHSLVTPETALYAIALLAPLAFLPLLAPGRLSVGVPLFAILCLNELERSRTPQHQFHAPLVPILFWSLAAALPRATSILMTIAQRFRFATENGGFDARKILSSLVWTSALSTGFFFSLSPLGISFWDSGSSWNWRQLYAPSHRAAMFSRIEGLIPRTARVASTDFVHPRYTHHDRSYDYSGYHRKVSGEGRRIPDDTDYLVIDTQHRYSTIKTPSDIPEWRDTPEQWELFPDDTEGYFIILKRKSEADSQTTDNSRQQR